MMVVPPVKSELSAGMLESGVELGDPEKEVVTASAAAVPDAEENGRNEAAEDRLSPYPSNWAKARLRAKTAKAKSDLEEGILVDAK